MDRVLRRVAFALIVIALAIAAAACATSKTAFPEDDEVSQAVYYQEPNAYKTALLGDPWLRSVKVGRSTFGREIPRIVRIEIDGAGRLQDRDVTLQTPPAVKLFRGPTEERMKAFLHGALSLVDERGGHLRGIAITSTRAGFEAAAISPFIEQNYIDSASSVFSKEEQRLIRMLLSLYAREQAGHTLAWYDLRSSWITIGAGIGTTIKLHAVNPKRVKAADGIFAAYVIRHEFEHAVTTSDFEQNEHVRWIEEGGADMLATWPGVAADTAKRLGFPYPKRYEKLRYTSKKGGYPAWRNTLYLLMQAAGIDITSPKAFDEASELLQGREPRYVPLEIATAIAREQGLDARRRARLVRQISQLDGNPKRARALVRAWL